MQLTLVDSTSAFRLSLIFARHFEVSFIDFCAVFICVSLYFCSVLFSLVILTVCLDSKQASHAWDHIYDEQGWEGILNTRISGSVRVFCLRACGAPRMCYYHRND